MFENQIAPSLPEEIAGCDTLLKRNIDTVLLSNTEITLMISVLQQMILVKCTTAMHTGWMCPFTLITDQTLTILPVSTLYGMDKEGDS